MLLAQDCCICPREMREVLRRWYNGSVWMLDCRCLRCGRTWTIWEDAPHGE